MNDLDTDQNQIKWWEDIHKKNFTKLAKSSQKVYGSAATWTS